MASSDPSGRIVLDPDTMRRARRELVRSDPRLGAWIESIGPLELSRTTSHYLRLLRAIIAQQLSNRAAKTIIDRVLALCASPHRPQPAELLALPDAPLRAAGLSGQKLGYIRDLSRAFTEGHLSRYPFSRRSDERVIADLVLVRGVGRWTAEMFLIFSLRRPDVFSAGDLALKHGVERITGMSELAQKALVEHAAIWAPWRSVACLYLWRIAHWEGESPAAAR